MTDSERKYVKYIKEHKENIKKGLKWFEENLPEYTTDEVYDLVNSHDMSKYSDEEFSPYAEYFYGVDESGKTSNLTQKQEVDKNFDYAWLHHIHTNPHHWQYWVLINDDDGTKALAMPKQYVIEMILDWWSFSWKQSKLDEIFNWYEKHEYKIQLHPETKKYIEEIFDQMKKKLMPKNDK